MTTELDILREEVENLKPYQADVDMLDALANNIVYILSKMQRQASQPDSIWQKHHNKLEQVLSDVLNTLNKELLWAKEETEDEDQRRHWFGKAQQQLLEDIAPLYD
jgi:hypothetical protein